MISMPHWPQPLWFEPTDTPIERTAKLLARVGNPEEKLPPLIHVAGTNGKGSTIAFLRHILMAAGYKVHAYVPPHIYRFNERILLDGKEIDDDFLHQLLEEARIAAGDDLPMTAFAGTTVAAFMAFSRVPADIFLLETGMGGRIDPTNVVRHPLATIITPIHYDHMEFLGDTLAKIASEKAGIMKRGHPCVVSFQQPEALAELKLQAKDKGVELYLYGEHWAVEKTREGFRYIDGNGSVEFPKPSLLGDHQLLNAGTAIAALSLLENFDISGEAIAEGLTHTQWKGRLEPVKTGSTAELLVEGWELWFDGGHNASCAYAMSNYAKGNWSDKPLYLITGTTVGKDMKAMLEPFKDVVEFICGVHVTAEPDAYPAEEAAKAAEKLDIPSQAFESMEDAVRFCQRHSADKPGRILVFGSFYLRHQAFAA
ncbi:MAG: bifunctional folylpolyglutamate synthase/dihydrofolate synthase [Proteobacteria bacterium]|nr:bifunctional folylpolyglutamate synthase/dihydrofolate synthase [Pseudomonadota bacterium]